MRKVLSLVLVCAIMLGACCSSLSRTEAMGYPADFYYDNNKKVLAKGVRTWSDGAGVWVEYDLAQAKALIASAQSDARLAYNLTYVSGVVGYFSKLGGFLSGYLLKVIHDDIKAFAKRLKNNLGANGFVLGTSTDQRFVIYSR